MEFLVDLLGLVKVIFEIALLSLGASLLKKPKI
jgi:hypothetical protein